MNKKIEEYKKKANRINRTIIALGSSIFLLGLVVSIVIYSINKKNANIKYQESNNENLEYYVDLEENSVLLNNNIDLNINIKNYEENNNYTIIIKLNDDNILEKNDIHKENKYNIDLKSEGQKKINIIIYKNECEEFNKVYTIYYIRPYVRQFLDEFSIYGTQVNYINGTRERYEKSLSLIKGCGFKNIRGSLLLGNIWNKDKKYNYNYYDEWVNECAENNINILAIITNVEKIAGTDQIMNSNEENQDLLEYILNLKSKYGNKIKWFEILNEPNYGMYYTDDEIRNYANLTNKITNKVDNIVVGATSGLEEGNDKYRSSIEFFNVIGEKTYNSTNIYSFHPYDIENWNNNNIKLNRLNKSHKDFFNKIGGFIKRYATEYGITSSTKIAPTGINEDIQAYKIVEQSIIMNKYDISLAIQYLFCNTGEDLNNKEHNYGLLRNNYTPKPSYYSMKNYLTNTNGSEYIGTVNLQDGLESHVYNKDGKPLIITWSQDTNKTYSQPLGTMTAKDLYGKEINADENGNIEVTTSPVYLYNVPRNYYYQAISNMATEKYTEFEEKFAEEISKVTGLKSTITNLKQRMQNIATLSTLDEATAIDLMKQHYNLGNTIIQAYKSGTLQIEDVKLSSMLDSLNDVGNSFEDLVTVSATTRNANINETSAKINEVDTLINNNQEVEIVYPSKILEFSKDFHEKASYINGLEEENDIKTGLIVSKNLHSSLLADWAKSFANIYVEKNIEKYIAEHPVTVKYSNTELTNQNITATLVSNGEFTVTNNSNSKEYTFTQNGTFTFKYEMKGRQFEVVATVNNIDKDLPTIVGVQNDGLYMVAVAPVVSDANLKEVKLYKNSNLVENYVVNSAISEDGNYSLVATDLAENEQKVNFYISRNPARITYSNTELTNQDVIAAVQSDFEFRVNNNSNSKNYTFKDNGTFEFDITIKQLPLKLTATVNNIDKIAPIIQGIEEGKTYIDEVTPKVSDTNLEKVELYLNGQAVSNYVANTKVAEEGLYKIVAKDKAGNSTTVSFQVLKNKEEGYKIQNNTVKNITNNTKMAEFKNNLNMNEQYDIYRNNQKLQENSVIATGDELKTKTGTTYTLIVVGDINKDGDVNIQDIVKMRKYLLERNNLDNIEIQAADTNLDGAQVNIQDLVRMRIIAINKKVE